jgi:hypothetical protein
VIESDFVKYLLYKENAAAMGFFNAVFARGVDKSGIVKTCAFIGYGELSHCRGNGALDYYFARGESRIMHPLFLHAFEGSHAAIFVEF